MRRSSSLAPALAPSQARLLAATLVAAAVLLAPGLALAGKGDRLAAGKVVGRMQGFYEKIRDLQASFKQAVSSPTTGRTNTSCPCSLWCARGCSTHISA